MLIHINPDHLSVAYDRLYTSSQRYILVCEYYSPVPVAISYRGHDDRLWKRDFAGEMMERFPELRLVASGFLTRHHQYWPQDDQNWFLLEKK